MKTIMAGIFVLFVYHTSCAQKSYKVLFLGNSYTYFNELPEQLYNLALAGGDTIKYESNTPGACSLGHPDNGHLYDYTSLALIAQGDWDFVILQDQSQMPVIPHYRDNYSYPGAEGLYNHIKEANECTEAMFFMTWGRKDGGKQCIEEYCSEEFVDFSHMQDSLEVAYMHMGNSLDSPVCPVGLVWKHSIENGNPVDLFTPDGSHPNLAGTYLTACAFYIAILHKSPAGLEYHAGLPEQAAEYLQSVAEEVMLNNLEQWNLILDKPVADFSYTLDGPEISCDDNSFGALTLTWDFGDGVTSEEMNPVHTYHEDGDFHLVQTVSNDCYMDIHEEMITILYYPVNDQCAEKVKLNYCKSLNKVLIHNLNLIDNALFSISSLEGKIYYVKRIDSKTNFLELEVPDLDEGVFLFNIHSDQGSTTQKLLLKH